MTTESVRKFPVERPDDEMQRLLIRIASRYINIPLSQVNETIENSLEEMGHCTHVDRAYIFEYDLNSNTARNTFEWCAEGIEPQIENLQSVSLDFIPEWVEKHLAGEPFIVENTSLLPNLGPGCLRDILEPQGIQSLITLPILHEGKLHGCVGFDAVKSIVQFSDHQKQLLKLFCEMLRNIQIRKNQEMEKAVYLKKIQDQHDKMRQFAYTISHKIRLHACNMEGMLDLMQVDMPNLALNETFNMLRESSRLLDESLKEINTVVTSNS